MPSTIMQISKADVRFGACPGGGGTMSAADAAGLTDFSCQVTSAEIQSSANTTTTSVPATFCGPASEVSTPVASTFTLNLEILQDWKVADGLSAWLFANDATEQCFGLWLDGSNDPVAYGKVIVTAGAFGGAPGTTLTATATLNIQGYPVITDPTGQSIRGADPLDLTVTVFGSKATAAGIASVTALKADATYGDGNGSAPAAMTTGQYVGIGANNAIKASYDGANWSAGAAT